MKDRIEIEKAENGFAIKSWCDKEENDDEYGYREPKTFVAETVEEAMNITKKELTKEAK